MGMQMILSRRKSSAKCMQNADELRYSHDFIKQIIIQNTSYYKKNTEVKIILFSTNYKMKPVWSSEKQIATPRLSPPFSGTVCSCPAACDAFYSGILSDFSYPPITKLLVLGHNISRKTELFAGRRVFSPIFSSSALECAP